MTPDDRSCAAVTAALAEAFGFAQLDIIEVEGEGDWKTTPSWSAATPEMLRRSEEMCFSLVRMTDGRPWKIVNVMDPQTFLAEAVDPDDAMTIFIGTLERKIPPLKAAS
jgi:hypothetical protein